MSNAAQTKIRAWMKAYRVSRGAALRRIFVGEQGIRAGWSVLLFVAIYLILEAVETAALKHFVPVDLTGPIPLGLGLLQESCEVLVVFVATLVMARIENRRVFSYGYIGNCKVVRLASGAVWGFLCLSVLVGVLWKAGLLVFDGVSLSGFTAWKDALGWALGFLVVGIFEESLLRGYLQYTLARGIGFWWAAAVLSVAFALGHVGNGGESLLGLLEVGLGGFIFCLSLWYIKSLWWAVGFHAGWDWAQSFFYGTPDSGLVMKDHLLASHVSGNPLWSGGAVGPEGSVLVLPLVIMVATGMWIWWGGSRLRKALLGDAVGFALLLAGLTGCRGSDTLGKGKPTLDLTSSSFREGKMPTKFTCDGAGDSPELAWAAPPAGTQSFALIAFDKDSLLGYSFTHWVLYDAPAEKRELPEGLPKQAQLPDGSRQGLNDFDKPGYVGPCPPGKSPHRYVFALYALDSRLNLPAGATRSEVEIALKGHVLAHGELVGRYQR